MPHVLYKKNYKGMLLEVIESSKERSLQSDRSIIHSRINLDFPDQLIQPYQKQMAAVLTLLSALPKRVLHLGLGGGCIASFLHKNLNVKQDVFECSNEIIDIAYRYFDFPKDDQITLYIKDASSLQPIAGKKYDVIFLDLCDSNGPIPYFQDVPYLRALREYLAPRGWVVANSWSSIELLKSEMGLWNKVFPSVMVSENNGEEVVIYGSNCPVSDQSCVFPSAISELASLIRHIRDVL